MTDELVKRPTPIERFMEKVVPVPESGCWLWLGGVDADGYGHMNGNRRAHRVSYERHVGGIPRGMFVCHHCDVPSCVNPHGQ